MARAANVSELIGGTDVVRLNHLPAAGSAEVWCKLESQGPGGSVKDRIGLAMIRAGEQDGALQPGATIIEPTSGNTGIALALVAAARGYRCILAMPESMSIERRSIMAGFGAELVLTPAKLGMKGAIEEAKRLHEKTPGSFIPGQFDNPANPEIHRTTTGEEIWADLDGRLDAFVCGVGTGGTITGVGRCLRQRGNQAPLIAVEPKASPVLSGGAPGPHRIQGIGAGFVPAVLDTDLLAEVIMVEESDAIAMRARLFREEGLMAGISSGASIWAALRVAERLGAGARVVTVVHDTGERYLSMNL